MPVPYSKQFLSNAYAMLGDSTAYCVLQTSNSELRTANVQTPVCALRTPVCTLQPIYLAGLDGWRVPTPYNQEKSNPVGLRV